MKTGVQGIYKHLKILDSGFRRNDGKGHFQTFYDFITLDRLEKEIRRFSEEEWRKDLERQLEGWSRELERSGDEVRRYFQQKIFPRLEQAVRDLLRRLKELGKEKDGKSLEEKLEQLKRTLHS
ncbi:MAG: hypothetical protein QME78_07510 [Thermodesulfobacteriota bacterium]|nr:hypothetical protein [Thermodesulfobacteriota bacterium]